jgi:hypothetical protein
MQRRVQLEEKLIKDLEKDVVDNVETNFLFNQGANLTSGLIDQDRLYLVMVKLKELAQK